MAKLQIDEEELLRHQHLAKTVSTIMGNPKSRVLVEQAVKLQWPDAKTPTLDEIEQQKALSTGLEKKIEDFISAQEKDKTDREQREKLNALNRTVEDGISQLRRQGWRDQGIDEVRKLMESKGILDPLDAAAIYERDHPPQQVMNPGATGAWNFMENAVTDTGDVDIKKLIETKGQSDIVADKMARDALADFRGQKRAA